jgi:hypothetical protein
MDTRASKRRGGGGADGGARAEGAGGSAAAAAVSLGGKGGGGQGHFATLSSDGSPEHQSPGYGAGYDAGFLAGLHAASQSRAPPPPPPAAAEGPACAGRGARPPLLALVEDFPDLFQKEVLERLYPVDRALLARTGSAVRTAVKHSDLARVGGSAEEARVGIAAFCQSLPTFVWAAANGCQWQFTKTCETLAEGGHLDVLRWAREHGCPWDEDTCACAADAGHMEVLRWVVLTCAKAAGGGHLEVLKWAREHHCPWEGATETIETDCCARAAVGGHLEVLKWLWAHDCPWDSFTCSSPLRAGT